MNFIVFLELILSILFLITLISSIVMLIKVKNKKKIKIFFGYIAEIIFISLFTTFLKTEIISTAVNVIGLLVCSVLTLLDIKKIFDSEKGKNNVPNTSPYVAYVPNEPNLITPYNGTPYYNETPYPTTSTPVKAKKSFPILVVIPIICIIAFIIVIVVQSNKMMKLYADTNGPTNYELNTITEDDFLITSFSTTFNSKLFNTGNTTTYSVKKLYGIKTIYETKSDDDTVVLDINSEVTLGNCEIAVIVDKKIYKVLEANTSDIITIKNANNKLIEVVVAGEEACIELEVTRKR